MKDGVASLGLIRRFPKGAGKPVRRRGEHDLAPVVERCRSNRGLERGVEVVFQPIEYPSVDRLIETMDAEIIEPAKAIRRACDAES